MLFSKYQFRFSIPATILAVSGLVLFISLGSWQIERAGIKQKLQTEIDVRQSKSSVRVTDIVGEIADNYHRNITAVGEYYQSNEILIDNEVSKGRAGYHVLTPLQLKDESFVILVNRGWVPIGRSRNVLPELKSLGGEVVLKGRLAPFKSRPALILDQSKQETGKVWSYFDSEKYKKITGYNLLPAVILLSEDSKDGFVRNWPEYSVNIGMHIGYAIQWYVFALIVLVTYVAVNLKKK